MYLKTSIVAIAWKLHNSSTHKNNIVLPVWGSGCSTGWNNSTSTLDVKTRLRCKQAPASEIAGCLQICEFLQDSTHEVAVELGIVLKMSSTDTLVEKRSNKSAPTFKRTNNWVQKSNFIVRDL